MKKLLFWIAFMAIPLLSIAQINQYQQANDAVFENLDLSASKMSFRVDNAYNPVARYGNKYEYDFPRATDSSCPESNFPNPNNTQYGATVTVAYGNLGFRPSPSCGNLTLYKPLIVIEGFDPSNILEGYDNWGYDEFLSESENGGIDVSDLSGNRIEDKLESGGYDLIFIDFHEGTGDIVQNARLVENIIQWVNAHKQFIPNTNIRELCPICFLALHSLSSIITAKTTWYIFTTRIMHKENVRFIDLFCGIGGFRVAFEEACQENEINAECVFSSDIDKFAQDSYEANFGERPHGDIKEVDEKEIPDHDILFAGFPCQPFSIIGQMKGLGDTRGTLFFDIARILQEKQPKAFILENVKQLVGHDKGKTLKVILKSLKDLGYYIHYSVLNALDFGLPQKRERIVIVGHREPILFTFPSPIRPYKPLLEILEKDVDPKHFASDFIREKRKNSHQSSYYPSIWHENKSGNICSYPYSCALRAGASYNYLLVNGERRLTPREMFRLQGFPDSYKIVVSDAQAKKQAGNAVPVNMIKAVALKLLPYISKSMDQTMILQEYDLRYNVS